MPSNKKKSLEDLSPLAKEFFQVFLKSKGKFVRPEARAFYRPYELKDDEMGEWDANVWDESVQSRIKMAIMDFRNIPGILNKGSSATDASYFEKFISILDEDAETDLSDPEVWLWIVGEKEVELELRSFIRTSGFGSSYSVRYAEYLPSAFERIGDVPERSTRAKDPIQLLFLVKNGAAVKTRKIPKSFTVPLRSHYNTRRQTLEVEYRIYDTELRMEFYLSVLGLFVSPRDVVVSYFAGGKITCAAWVSPDT
jgi:hypothetical protein